MRLPGFDLSPEQIMGEADTHGPFVAQIVLYSGGGDSTALLHYALAHGWTREAAFIDTGTALPGVREQRPSRLRAPWRWMVRVPADVGVERA